MPDFAASFAKPAAPTGGFAVIFATDGGALGPLATAIDSATSGAVSRAISKADFKGKQASVLDLIAPGEFDRVLVVGLGKVADIKERDWLKLGGTIAGKLIEARAAEATVLLEAADGPTPAAPEATGIALGAGLRAYVFDRYKVRKKDETGLKALKLTVTLADHAAAKKLWHAREAALEGTNLARDLVIEPPNVLFPEEFARRASELEKLGVEIEILDEKKMKKLGMGALLGVAQGSERPPRLAVMKWQGAKDKKEKPIAFIGKGVTFDTGGISLKPGAGMEDMKGDMGGAAVVTGLMHALASRKARVNVIGAIGLVENMPDGKAQRPGDIVTSMSGQTIEIINTDAEGRLVLGDVLWYVKETYKPRFMLDLATLTGAIVVALGKHHAGLFTNSDDLAAQLSAAGEATGEAVWRMPLGPEYDKMIDSQFADMKNTGGRDGGSITAAQFLKRFVDDVPWVHLDIAGTGLSAPQTEINRAWSSGWGVRLLDRLVKDNYEG